MWWINASAPLFGTKLTRPKVRAECYAHSALNAILTIFYIHIRYSRTSLIRTTKGQSEVSVSLYV